MTQDIISGLPQSAQHSVPINDDIETDTVIIGMLHYSFQMLDVPP